ncbi:MAG: N-acetylmuramic acid 6-phosphate etherase [Bacteroidota bacterium]|nr:N-acetylmuramic acid 6-phosphate etherase [Bacteroidota bacterium]
MNKMTEQDSSYRHLERMSLSELLHHINDEDKTVPVAIEKAIDSIEKLANAAYSHLANGGRVFYIGSGTSGRLGVLDASECPPTYGVDQGIVVGIIAGGDAAIRVAQEGAEDDMQGAWRDLEKQNVTKKDFVIGISASGSTPYVLGGLRDCRNNGIVTGSISCNPDSLTSSMADFPVEVITGPEFVTGSTRMKAGTAQKLVLNMISTAAMIKLGRVRDNKMVDMRLSNKKLIDRGIRMVMELYGISYSDATELLEKFGSVRNVILAKPLS